MNDARGHRSSSNLRPAAAMQRRLMAEEGKARSPIPDARATAAAKSQAGQLSRVN